jgi:uncharacterized membrane protein
VISPGIIHVAAALTAILVGAYVLAARKGTVRHRRLGYLYLAAMGYVNFAALAIDTNGALGPFHALAFVSLANLAAGYLVLLLAPPGRRRTDAHGMLMMWSYSGVVTAGIGQGAAALAAPVGPVIGLCVAVSAVLIHVVRPHGLRFAT